MGRLNLVNALAAILPEDEIIKRIELQIKKWKNDKCLDNLDSVVSTGVILHMKVAQLHKNKNTEDAFNEISDEIDKAGRATSLINRIEGKTN